MKKSLAVFSYLFHPLFVPLFAVLLFFLLDPTYFALGEKFLVLIQTVIVTILIPVSFFFLLRSLGKIDSVMAPKLSQRKLPLLLQAVLFYILVRQPVFADRIPELYYFFWSALTATVLALVFLYFKIKISLHLLGMSALLFFVIGLSYYNHSNSLFVIAFLLLMTGFVASSRLSMNAHDLTELFLGFGSGMCAQIFFWYFWL